MVTYATELKRRLLGVTADARSSRPSAPCRWPAGCATLLDVDWALSTTGVAGPDLQEGQPAGTVFVGLAGRESVRFVRLALDGDRAAIRSGACAGALDLLLAEVSGG